MKRSILFIWIAILLLDLSCEKKPTGPGTQKPTFTVYGVVVKDLNISKDIASFTVSRNDTLYNNAIVKAGNKVVPNTGSGAYYQEFSDTTFHGLTVYEDSIKSLTDTVNITFGFAMPNTFSASINPADSVNENALAVRVTWTVSDSSTAYIISVIKGDAIPGAVLYVASVTGPSVLIPQEAFRSANGNPVSGLYWVYVIAYNQSFVSYPNMPFTLPSNLPANNILGATGTLGAGVVAQKVVIRVL